MEQRTPQTSRSGFDVAAADGRDEADAAPTSAQRPPMLRALTSSAASKTPDIEMNALQISSGINYR